MMNGLKKRVYGDGTIVLAMANNDIKVCHPDGSEQYLEHE